MKSSREQFEEWIRGKLGYYESARKDALTGDYTLSEVRKMWGAWQASRQALANEEVTTAAFVKVE